MTGVKRIYRLIMLQVRTDKAQLEATADDIPIIGQPRKGVEEEWGRGDG
ncbi:MAG: hypothetical protein R3E82_21435 [Pseudomonadales bacterium]